MYTLLALYSMYAKLTMFTMYALQILVLFPEGGKIFFPLEVRLDGVRVVLEGSASGQAAAAVLDLGFVC